MHLHKWQAGHLRRDLLRPQTSDRDWFWNEEFALLPFKLISLFLGQFWTLFVEKIHSQALIIITVRWSRNGLVWDNLPLLSTSSHILVRVLKFSSNWTKLTVMGSQLFSEWCHMFSDVLRWSQDALNCSQTFYRHSRCAQNVFRCSQMFTDVFGCSLHVL